MSGSIQSWQRMFLGLLLWCGITSFGLADESPTLLNPETQYSLPSGATFNVPKGWGVHPKDKMVILTDPERLVTIIIADSDETAVTDAIQNAWKSYNPDFSYAVASKSVPKRDDWDQVYRFWYYVPSAETPFKADEKRGLYAIARQKKGRWYIGLMDYDFASADKRYGQDEEILGSLKVPGEDPTPTPSTLAVQLDDKSLKSFEDFLEHARNDCKVPGAAVAIVEDGKVAYEKGFGVCEKGKKDPVTTKTLFSIGGITQSLTSLLMARLVDAGKMTWDTPVTQLLPNFQLADPKSTGELSMKYTVCACAGFRGMDTELIFSMGIQSPQVVMDKLRSMSPDTNMGETYRNSDFMDAVGGFAAAHILHPELPPDQAYAAAMKEVVFDPLGMADSTVGFNSITTQEHGTPHCFQRDNDYTTVPLDYLDWTSAITPAEGAWSNVDDMAKYLLLELNKGIGPDGTRIVSEANLLKRREPQVKIAPESSFGLGLKVSDDKGISVIGHGGSPTGYTSDMVFFPDLNLGMVLLTNGDKANFFRSAVYRKLVELISTRPAKAQEDLDKDISGWQKNGQLLENWANAQMAQSWFYDFVGVYSNPDLGVITLKMTQEGGMFNTIKWKSHVAGEAGRNGETYFYLTDPPLVWNRFILKDDDGHKTMTYKTAQKDYVFEWVSKAD